MPNQIKQNKRVKGVKHRHTWEYNYDDCPRCGYTERCCKKCSVCEGSDPDTMKWVKVCD